jgi:hypothetical protein
MVGSLNVGQAVCLDIQNGVAWASDTYLTHDVPVTELTLIAAEIAGAMAENFSALLCGSGSPGNFNVNADCQANPTGMDCQSEAAAGACICGPYWNANPGSGPQFGYCGNNSGWAACPGSNCSDSLCACMYDAMVPGSPEDPNASWGCRNLGIGCTNMTPLQAMAACISCNQQCTSLLSAPNACGCMLKPGQSPGHPTGSSSCSCTGQTSTGAACVMSPGATAPPPPGSPPGTPGPTPCATAI